MNYEWMRWALLKYRAETDAKPHLTIVRNNFNTTQGDATMEKTRDDMKAELRSILREPTAEPVRPLHEHGAFDDLAAANRLLALGADALKGIGTMLSPESEGADEQVSARRSEISAVFEFFGEVLKEPAMIVGDAADRLEMAAKRHQV